MERETPMPPDPKPGFWREVLTGPIPVWKHITVVLPFWLGVVALLWLILYRLSGGCK